MKRGIRVWLGVLGSTGVALAVLGIGSAANAAIVPNRFERSCYVTCSPYVQVNGPYVSSVPSVCVTKTWFGITSSYTLPAGQRC